MFESLAPTANNNGANGQDAPHKREHLMCLNGNVHLALLYDDDSVIVTLSGLTVCLDFLCHPFGSTDILVIFDFSSTLISLLIPLFL